MSEPIYKLDDTLETIKLTTAILKFVNKKQVTQYVAQAALVLAWLKCLMEMGMTREDLKEILDALDDLTDEGI